MRLIAGELTIDCLHWMQRRKQRISEVFIRMVYCQCIQLNPTRTERFVYLTLSTQRIERFCGFTTVQCSVSHHRIQLFDNSEDRTGDDESATFGNTHIHVANSHRPIDNYPQREDAEWYFYWEIAESTKNLQRVRGTLLVAQNLTAAWVQSLPNVTLF